MNVLERNGAMAKHAVFMEFETKGGRFLVAGSTLLRCLEIAIDERRLPPLDETWMRRAREAVSVTPPSEIDIVRQDAGAVLVS
jgi:hypothetical protein